MARKISRIVFWISVFADLVSIIERGMKMLDMRVFLELVILAIAVVSGTVYLSERKKEKKSERDKFNAEYESLKSWIGYPSIDLQKNPEGKVSYHNLMGAIEHTVDRRLESKK